MRDSRIIIFIWFTLLSSMKIANFVVECNSKQVLCNIIAMEKCAYIWLSLDGSEPNLGNLVAAMETNFGVLSTSLIGVGEDKGTGLAQRLSKRFKIQALVADTLPELDSEDEHLVERNVVSQLQSLLAAIKDELCEG